MGRHRLLSVLLALLLTSCNEPLPTQLGSELVGVWVGQIDSNSLRIEFAYNDGALEGLLTWETGSPVILHKLVKSIQRAETRSESLSFDQEHEQAYSR